MRNVLKYIGIGVITLLYTLLIGFTSLHATTYSFHFNEADLLNYESNSSCEKDNLYYHVIQSEHVSCNQSTSFAKSSVPFYGLNYCNQDNLLIGSQDPFKEYNQPDLTSFKSTDIIFPFHYFW